MLYPVWTKNMNIHQSLISKAFVCKFSLSLIYASFFFACGDASLNTLDADLIESDAMINNDERCEEDNIRTCICDNGEEGQEKANAVQGYM